MDGLAMNFLWVVRLIDNNFFFGPHPAAGGAVGKDDKKNGGLLMSTNMCKSAPIL
jgi:hypothetical protein